MHDINDSFCLLFRFMNQEKKTKIAMTFLGKRRRIAMIEFSKTTRGRKKKGEKL
jgi:non-homologous end joining protein Ku